MTIDTNSPSDSQPITSQERQVIDKIRQAQRQARGKPFVLVVQYPGGKAPLQFFRAGPSGRIDNE